ncbi:hypothetical protein AD935_00800 [Gluconobacter japonicus]|nr:hypothetical protein AD935_00800 [Gluconobacter japonicus]
MHRISFEQWIVERRASGIFKAPAKTVTDLLKLEYGYGRGRKITSQRKLQDWVYSKTHNIDLTEATRIIFREYENYRDSWQWHDKAVEEFSK